MRGRGCAVVIIIVDTVDMRKPFRKKGFRFLIRSRSVCRNLNDKLRFSEQPSPAERAQTPPTATLVREFSAKTSPFGDHEVVDEEVAISNYFMSFKHKREPSPRGEGGA